MSKIIHPLPLSARGQSVLGRSYGWHHDKHDPRDLRFAVPQHIAAAPLPAKVDLRPNLVACYNQGQASDCTANALGGAHQYCQIQEMLTKGSNLEMAKSASWIPARLFIYYNERAIEGTVDQDCGAQIRDGAASLANLGVCPETLWPHDPTRYAIKPSDDCYVQALRSKAVQYNRVNQTLDDLRGCLAAGFPFAFGFTVYESFEGNVIARSGTMPMPKPGEKVLGGHAVLAVGYYDSAQDFTVRNSWGQDWGDDGHFYMPYDFITDNDQCDDFWTIRFLND